MLFEESKDTKKVKVLIEDLINKVVTSDDPSERQSQGASITAAIAMYAPLIVDGILHVIEMRPEVKLAMRMQIAEKECLLHNAMHAKDPKKPKKKGK